MNRLERFRDYISRLDPAGDPAEAIKRGFYVAPVPGGGRSLAQEIAARLVLQPSSSHVVFGGIGAGKTTELLVAVDEINKTSDTQAIYVDLSRRNDLSKLQPGALIVMAGLAVTERADTAKKADPRCAEIVRWLKERADGYSYPLWEDQGDDDGQYGFQPGILHDPLNNVSESVRGAADILAEFLKIAFSAPRHYVFLFDSLDRISDMNLFAKVLSEDVTALRSIGLGIVVVAPPRAMYGLDRAIAEVFDRTYLQPTINPRPGQLFLYTILRNRVDTSLLSDEGAELAIEMSGGILRDLLQIAQEAGQEAYMHGGDTVNRAHVQAAANAIARPLLFGLGADQVEVLQKLRKTGSFLRTSERDVELLVTRRVLEYRDPIRYAVHPALAPLLAQLAGES